ncbi:hypothetical protein DSECCO2_641390 [anaerobic digester metagenome]
MRLRGKGVDQDAGEKPPETDDGEDHPEVIGRSPLADILEGLPFLREVEPDDAFHEKRSSQFQPFKEEQGTEAGDKPDDDGDKYDPPVRSDGFLDLHEIYEIFFIRPDMLFD